MIWTDSENKIARGNLEDSMGYFGLEYEYMEVEYEVVWLTAQGVGAEYEVVAYSTRNWNRV